MNGSEKEREEHLRAGLAADLDGSFPGLVVAFQDRMYAFALRLTGSPRDAEEIAQDAFVRAYRALRGYPAERVQSLALKAWLYQITLNVARNSLRSRRPATISLDSPDEDDSPIDLPDDGAELPEASLERAEEREVLARLVVGLPDRYRPTVVLRYVQGLSYVEVAAILGQPIGTVKANAHRGIRLLRARLSQEEPSADEEWRYIYGNGTKTRVAVGTAASEKASRAR